MHEERARRKEMQEEMKRIQEQNKLMEERFKQITERLKPPAPDFNEDPLGALKHQNEELERRTKEYEQWREQQETAKQQEIAKQQFISRYQHEAQTFAAQTPDFNDSYKFLIESRQNELAAVGYSQQETREHVWVGVIAIFGGLAPVIVANRHIVLPDYSRYTLIASIRAV